MRNIIPINEVPKTKLPKHIRIGIDLKKLLTEFRKKDVNAVIWNRSPVIIPDELIENITEEHTDVFYENDLKFGIELASAYPYGTGRAGHYIKDLAEDLAFLCKLRKRLKHSIRPCLNVNLRKGQTAKLDDAGRFHVDGYAIRILVTYKGPTTVFVDNKDAKPFKDHFAVEPKTKIYSIPLGSVLILKGAGRACGLIHKAPEETSDRLMAAINW